MNKVSRHLGDNNINMELKLWKNLNNSFEETQESMNIKRRQMKLSSKICYVFYLCYLVKHITNEKINRQAICSTPSIVLTHVSWDTHYEWRRRHRIFRKLWLKISKYDKTQLSAHVR